MLRNIFYQLVLPKLYRWEYYRWKLFLIRSISLGYKPITESYNYQQLIIGRIEYKIPVYSNYAVRYINGLNEI